MKCATLRGACVNPPPESSGAAAAPSLLSGYWRLREQMSKEEKPLSKWEESFHHRLLNREGREFPALNLPSLGLLAKPQPVS